MQTVSRVSLGILVFGLVAYGCQPKDDDGSDEDVDAGTSGETPPDSNDGGAGGAGGVAIGAAGVGGDGGGGAATAAGSGGVGGAAPDCEVKAPLWPGELTYSNDVHDSLTSMRMGSCGNIVLTGTSDTDLTAATQVQHVMVVTPDGGVEPLEVASAPVGSPRFIMDAVERDGRVYFVAMNTNGARAALVEAYAADRTLAWSTPLKGDFSTLSVDVDAHGNVYVGGFAGGDLPLELPDQEGDGYIAKLDSAGEHLWSARTLGGGAATNADGISYTAGTDAGEANSELIRDAYLSQYDADGALVWRKPLGIPEEYVGSFDQLDANSVTLSADGTAIFVTGMLSSSECPRQCEYGFVIGKFDAAGTRSWRFVPTGEGSTFGYGVAALAPNADGSRLFAYLDNGELFRYDGAGVIGWQLPVIENSANIYRLAVDAAGDLVLGGAVIPLDASENNQSDLYLLRRHGADASLFED